RMLRGAAAVHYTTGEERRLAEQSLRLTNGVVIPLGVTIPADVRRSTKSVDKPYVLALSRIHPKKNFELLIRAFLEATASPELSNWRLVIAGDGEPDYVGTLRALARACGGGDRVSFAGWLEGEAKTQALANAELFALPSSQENFGIAAVEAMSLGVPVLVSRNVNLAPEIDGGGIGWASTLEPEEFICALANVLRDEPARRDRGARGRDFVARNYSWAESANKLIAIYRDVQRRNESSSPRADEFTIRSPRSALEVRAPQRAR